MSTRANVLPEAFPDRQASASGPLAATRPLYWSVRRELWENRSVYIAPLGVAVVFLFGFLISTVRLRQRMLARLALEAARQRAAVRMPYDAAAFLILLTAFIVAVFYCLDALHGERRDRSILFWKSLPVSDLTAVLSKAAIPVAVLPAVVFPLTVATQTIMLLLSTLVLLGSRPSLDMLWAQLPLFKMWLALLYGLVAMTLWYAPVYGWLLLVSAWARRAAFLWAVLPFFAVCIFERIAFGSSHFAGLLAWRFAGWFLGAFAFRPHGTVAADPLAALTPGRFLSAPGLWLGLIVAAALFAAAARLRRSGGPI